MKKNLMLYLDVEIIAQAKATFPNLSQKVEDLLRAALDIPINPDEAMKEQERQKRMQQLENVLNANNANVTALQLELLRLQKEDEEERKKEVWY